MVQTWTPEQQYFIVPADWQTCIPYCFIQSVLAAQQVIVFTGKDSLHDGNEHMYILYDEVLKQNQNS